MNDNDRIRAHDETDPDFVPANMAPSARKPRVFFPPAAQERRKKTNDAVRSLVNVATIATWALIIAGVSLAVGAQPFSDSAFSRLLNIQVIGMWNRGYLQTSNALFIAALVVGIAGFVLSLLRLRRKSDKLNALLLIGGVLSFAGIVCMQILL